MQIKVFTDRETLKLMGKGKNFHVLHPSMCGAYLCIDYKFIFVLRYSRSGLTDNLGYELFQVKSMHLLSLITEVILIGLLDGF